MTRQERRERERGVAVVESSSRESGSDAALLRLVRSGDPAAARTLRARHFAAAVTLAGLLTARDDEGPAGQDGDSRAVALASAAWDRICQALRGGGGPGDAFRPHLLAVVARIAGGAGAQQAVELPGPGQPFVDLTRLGADPSLTVLAFVTLPETWTAVLWHTEVELAAPSEIAPLLGLTSPAAAGLARRARAGLRAAYLRLYRREVADPACCATADDLAASARDERPRHSAAAAGHLRTCRRCQAAYAQVTDVSTALRSTLAPVVLGGAAAAYCAAITGPPAVPAPGVPAPGGPAPDPSGPAPDPGGPVPGLSGPVPVPGPAPGEQRPGRLGSTGRRASKRRRIAVVAGLAAAGIALTAGGLALAADGRSGAADGRPGTGALAGGRLSLPAVSLPAAATSLPPRAILTTKRADRPDHLFRQPGTAPASWRAPAPTPEPAPGPTAVPGPTAAPGPTRPPPAPPTSPSPPRPVPSSAAPRPVILLSQDHPVTASSVESYVWAAAYAADGSTGTRWSSAWSDPQWLEVDLGAAHAITSVVLDWETAYATAFQIQVSGNGSTWTTFYSTTTGAGGGEELPVSGTGRYVRMYGTRRVAGYGYSLWEFQVFGS